MKHNINIALKTALLESGKTQRRIAKLARMSEPRLSHIVRGRSAATPDEKQRLARLVGKNEDELFSEAS